MSAPAGIWGQTLADADDLSLLGMVRDGDPDAYAELWRRYLPAAYAVAHRHRGRTSAEDIVADASLRVYDLIRAGKGPTTNFRSYFLSAVRTAAVDAARTELRAVPTEDAALESATPAVEAYDASASVDHDLVRAAFRRLPERDQQVLWHTAVEGTTPAVVASSMGMSANGVSVLALRARDSLRAKYLDAHADRAIERAQDAECAWVLAQMGRFVRGKLPVRQRARVSEHLATCSHARGLALEMTEVNRALPALMVPLIFLGGTSVASAWAGGVGAGASAGGADGPRGPREEPKAALAAALMANVGGKAAALAVGLVLGVGYVAAPGGISAFGGGAGGAGASAGAGAGGGSVTAGGGGSSGSGSTAAPDVPTPGTPAVTAPPTSEPPPVTPGGGATTGAGGTTSPTTRPVTPPSPTPTVRPTPTPSPAPRPTPAPSPAPSPPAPSPTPTPAPTPTPTPTPPVPVPPAPATFPTALSWGVPFVASIPGSDSGVTSVSFTLSQGGVVISPLSGSAWTCTKAGSTVTCSGTGPAELQIVATPVPTSSPVTLTSTVTSSAGLSTTTSVVMPPPPAPAPGPAAFPATVGWRTPFAVTIPGGDGARSVSLELTSGFLAVTPAPGSADWSCSTDAPVVCSGTGPATLMVTATPPAKPSMESSTLTATVTSAGGSATSAATLAPTATTPAAEFVTFARVATWEVPFVADVSVPASGITTVVFDIRTGSLSVVPTHGQQRGWVCDPAGVVVECSGRGSATISVTATPPEVPPTTPTTVTATATTLDGTSTDTVVLPPPAPQPPA